MTWRVGKGGRGGPGKGEYVGGLGVVVVMGVGWVVAWEWGVRKGDSRGAGTWR